LGLGGERRASEKRTSIALKLGKERRVILSLNVLIGELQNKRELDGWRKERLLTSDKAGGKHGRRLFTPKS